MTTTIRCLMLLSLLAALAACSGQPEPGAGQGAGEASRQDVTMPAAGNTGADEAEQGEAAAFDDFVDALIEEMLERSPEWAIYQGRYEHAGEVSIPDAERRRGELAFIASALERLQ